MHSYISKCQTRYQKKIKSWIYSSTVLFLGDFTENYQFVIQDEVQGFHWNNSQSTLHPVVTYYQENHELQNISCVISDDGNMMLLWFMKYKKAILANLKCKVPGLSTIIYFTDECAGQYKNWEKTIIIFVSTKAILEWMGDEYFLSLVMVMWWNEMWYDLLPPSDMLQFCKGKYSEYRLQIYLQDWWWQHKGNFKWKIWRGNMNSRHKIISWILQNRSMFYWDEKNKWG